MSVPFDDGDEHEIIGANLDEGSQTLYLSLSGAGQGGENDRPQLIVAFKMS